MVITEWANSRDELLKSISEIVKNTEVIPNSFCDEISKLDDEQLYKTYVLVSNLSNKCNWMDANAINILKKWINTFYWTAWKFVWNIKSWIVFFREKKLKQKEEKEIEKLEQEINWLQRLV